MKIDPYCQQQNCSPLNVLFSNVQISLISQGVHPLGGVKQGRCEKMHMRFRLTPRSMTLDDLELLSVRFFERIAQNFADFGGNNSYTNEYRTGDSVVTPMNVLFNVPCVDLS